MSFLSTGPYPIYFQPSTEVSAVKEAQKEVPKVEKQMDNQKEKEM